MAGYKEKPGTGQTAIAVRRVSPRRAPLALLGGGTRAGASLFVAEFQAARGPALLASLLARDRRAQIALYVPLEALLATPKGLSNARKALGRLMDLWIDDLRAGRPRKRPAR